MGYRVGIGHLKSSMILTTTAFRATTELLIDWQVKYRETGGSSTTIALGTDGQVVIGGDFEQNLRSL